MLNPNDTKSFFQKTLLATGVFFSAISISNAEVDKDTNIMLLSHWGPDGGTHGMLGHLIDGLEDKGWTINNGKGAVSLSSCAKQNEIKKTSEDPVVYLVHTSLITETQNDSSDPCHYEISIEDDYIGHMFTWRDFISRAAGKDLPPLHKAEGLIRVGVETVNIFTKEHEEALKRLAPNATPILIRYTGTGQVAQGVKAGEVDYTWQAITPERSDGAVVTDYHVGDVPVDGIPMVSDVVPGFDFTDPQWAIHFSTGLKGETQEQFRKDYYEILTTDPVIKDMFKNRKYSYGEAPNEVDTSVVAGRLGMSSK